MQVDQLKLHDSNPNSTTNDRKNSAEQDPNNGKTACGSLLLEFVLSGNKQTPIEKNGDYKISRRQDKGKAPASSKNKGKGKARDLPLQSNSVPSTGGPIDDFLGDLGMEDEVEDDADSGNVEVDDDREE
ncbi:hypothetical protein HAX54_050391 [Datura stramonium]|uniref:Uncharacterized protein n=1 Tax=Datura stramonium TaxID=4076 RepID=A0ABS8WP57_DATST|nr:hypothetical protein [Datura stramonium]